MVTLYVNIFYNNNNNNINLHSVHWNVSIDTRSREMKKKGVNAGKQVCQCNIYRLCLKCTSMTDMSQTTMEDHICFHRWCPSCCKMATYIHNCY